MPLDRTELTLQDLNGVVPVECHVAALLLHELHELTGHALLCHELVLLPVQLQGDVGQGDLVEEGACRL